jgi:hypothetical protein
MARYSKLVALIKPQAAAPGASSTGPVAVRIVDDPNAPATRAIDYDETHPNRQRELIAKVNSRLPPGTAINTHDIVALRRTHQIDAQRKFFHKSRFGSPQYSDHLVDWIIGTYANDPALFSNAREQYKRLKTQTQHA